jgi:exonuclease III
MGSENIIASFNHIAKIFNPNFKEDTTTQQLLSIQSKLHVDQTKSLHKTIFSEYKNICKRKADNFCEECDDQIRFKKQKNNHIIIVHTNVRGLNGNIDFANNSCMTSNICFFTECMCESQLLFENGIYAPNKKLFSKNSVKFKKKGRPTGGLLFTVDSNLNAKCKFISRRTGILTINKLAIIGTYLPSHDSRPSTEIAFKKELMSIEQEIRKLEAKNYDIMLIGDFNVDLRRSAIKYKRRDIFESFIYNNHLTIQENLFKQDIDHSYHYSYKDKNQTNIMHEVKSILDYTISNQNNTNFVNVKRYVAKKK